MAAEERTVSERPLRDVMANLNESSPRSPIVDGVEKELPGFQRFDRYPTALEKDCESCRDASGEGSCRGDDAAPRLAFSATSGSGQPSSLARSTLVESSFRLTRVGSG